MLDVGGTKLIAVAQADGMAHCSIRPEDILISIEPLRSSARNSFEGVITDIVDRSSVLYVTVSVPPNFTCMVTRQSFAELELRKGVRVWITFKASAIHVF